MINIQENTATASRNQYRSSAQMAAAGSQRLPESALHSPAVFPLQHMGVIKNTISITYTVRSRANAIKYQHYKALLSNSCLTKITVTLWTMRKLPLKQAVISNWTLIRQGYYTVNCDSVWKPEQVKHQMQSHNFQNKCCGNRTGTNCSAAGLRQPPVCAFMIGRSGGREGGEGIEDPPFQMPILSCSFWMPLT